MMKRLIALSWILVTFSCSENKSSDRSEVKAELNYQSIGHIERLDSALSDLISPDAKIEILASGFDWSEGPLWLEDQQALIFSDVPQNKIWKWTEKDSLSLYLEPSGFMGDIEGMREPGSNGLVLDPEGNLVLCQHGERRIAKMKASLDSPKPEYEVLASEFEGKRFNSPNDLIYNSKGQLFFTDPPYGLDDFNPKELDFQGVYRLETNGDLTLLIDSLSRPNGVGLSPDERTLYIAQSNAQMARYYAYELDDNGDIERGRVLIDMTSAVGSSDPGLPDGFTVDAKGNLFASGPGGIWVISPEGKVLGKIMTGQGTSNCVFDHEYRFLYITSDDKILRVKMNY